MSILTFSRSAPGTARHLIAVSSSHTAAFSTSRSIADAADLAQPSAPSKTSAASRFASALGIKTPELPNGNKAAVTFRRLSRNTPSVDRPAQPRQQSASRQDRNGRSDERSTRGKEGQGDSEKSVRSRPQDGQSGQANEQPRYRREREGGGDWQPRRLESGNDRPKRDASRPGSPQRRTNFPARREQYGRDQTSRFGGRGKEVEVAAESMPSERVQTAPINWNSPMSALAYAPRGLVAPPRDESDPAKIPFASLQLRPLRAAERALRMDVVQARPTLSVAVRGAYMQSGAPLNKLQTPLERLAADPGLSSEDATKLRHQALDEEAGEYERFSVSSVAQAAGLQSDVGLYGVVASSPQAVAASAASLNPDLAPDSKAFVVRKVVESMQMRAQGAIKPTKTIDAGASDKSGKGGKKR